MKKIKLSDILNEDNYKIIKLSDEYKKEIFYNSLKKNSKTSFFAKFKKYYSVPISAILVLTLLYIHIDLDNQIDNFTYTQSEEVTDLSQPHEESYWTEDAAQFWTMSLEEDKSEEEAWLMQEARFDDSVSVASTNPVEDSWEDYITSYIIFSLLILLNTILFVYLLKLFSYDRKIVVLLSLAFIIDIILFYWIIFIFL